MNNIRIVSASVLTMVAMAFGGASAFADQLDEVHKINKERTERAQQSQARIDKLQDERLQLLDEYKAVNKVIDGLRVYNARMDRLIAAQQVRISELDDAIVQAVEMKRQVTPLMVRMLDGLERFIALDLPFLQEERQRRLDFIRNALDNPDVSDAEKFRQVLEGYQIEAAYGRTVEAYDDVIDINGVDINVNVLKVGRISLVAQTKDERITLAWDKAAGDWVELPNSYRNAARLGIRMANGQATRDIMMLPVPAPENAE